MKSLIKNIIEIKSNPTNLTKPIPTHPNNPSPPAKPKKNKESVCFQKMYGGGI